MSQPITVIKRNLVGDEVLCYEGVILRRDADVVVIEAYFDRPDMLVGMVMVRKGDRFVETYCTDRWYNILEIHDRDGDRLKGWYCNIAQPAVLENKNRLSYVDLALDLWVSPDGKQTIMDEDEFTALSLDAQTRTQAWMAMEELQRQFRKNNKPGL